MSRPCKRRRVCRMPGCQRFISMNEGLAIGTPTATENRPQIIMTVDEYESIRLIDLLGLSQEECAIRMNVARTTAQAIYSSARLKLAQFIVYEGELKINGGEYTLCGGEDEKCPCCRYTDIAFNHYKEENIMRIAVTYQAGQVFQHFGHTEKFKIYDVQDGKVNAGIVVDTDGSGHGALADFLKNYHVEMLICGGIGGGARQALNAAGIAIYGGVSGGADQAVEDFLADKLNYDPDAKCNHHGDGHTCGDHHGDGHTCGNHGCGSKCH